MVEAREAAGPFTSLFDFCERVDMKRLNKKTIEALVKAGAFDFLEHPRARLTVAIDAAIERAQNTQRDREAGQSNLFGLLVNETASDSDDEFPPEVMRIDEWPEQELLAQEKSSLGFYISGHPLNRFTTLIQKYATATIESLTSRKNNERVTLGGVQTSIRIRPFKNGEGRMAIINFEDLTGSCEIVAMGDAFDRYEELLTSDEPLLLTGTLRIDRDEDGVRLSVRLRSGRGRGQSTSSDPDVVSLHEVRATRSEGITIEVGSHQLNDHNASAMATLFGDQRYAGKCDVRLVVKTAAEHGDATVTLKLPNKLKPSDELSHALKRLFGGECRLTTR